MKFNPADHCSAPHGCDTPSGCARDGTCQGSLSDRANTCERLTGARDSFFEDLNKSANRLDAAMVRLGLDSVFDRSHGATYSSIFNEIAAELERLANRKGV